MGQDATRPLVGVFWMVVTGVLFVIVTAIVKHVGSDLPAIQSAFLRFLFGLVFLLPAIGVIRAARIDARSWRFFVARGVAHAFAVGFWFFAMARIPMAEVVAMNYLNPVYVTIGAALFLGERLALRRIVAVAVALLGALVILRPGFREIEPGHIAMLGASLGLGASYLIAKRVSGHFDPAVVVGMMSIMVTLFLAPFAFAVWVTPSAVQLGWLVLVAGVATGAHYSMTLAFRAAPVSVTQPVTFLQLIWASILGVVLFSEAVDPWVFAGGGLIIAAVSYIAWREARLKRAAVTPQTEATKL